MKITRVRILTYNAAYQGGTYAMSHGRVSSHQRSLVTRIDTDDGVTGWGETCPHGRTYLPSSFEGELAAFGILAPVLLGSNPCNLAEVRQTMNKQLSGGNAAKSAIDAACWDLLGKSTGLTVGDLLGGRLHDTLPLFTALPVADAKTQAAFAFDEVQKGVHVLQVKVGDDPLVDAARVRAVVEAVGPDSTVVADANGGWNLSSALLAAAALADLPVYLEQPCRRMSDCAELRKHTDLPLVLDESVVDTSDLIRAKQIGATGINLKPSRVGGLSQARVMRDVALDLGMTMTIDDTWGGSLVSAQIAAVAVGASEDSLLGVTNFARVTEPSVGRGSGNMIHGRSLVPTDPGLGVEVDESLLVDLLLDTASQESR